MEKNIKSIKKQRPAPVRVTLSEVPVSTWETMIEFLKGQS